MHSNQVKSVVNALGNLSDAELVKMSHGGSREAFGGIVERYQGLVAAFLFSRCRGDLALSEELAQQAFIHAWKDLSKLRDPTRLSSWLCGIARNIHSNFLRKTEREKQRRTSIDQVEELSDSTSDPSETVISQEEQQILWNALEHIPETYREPMVLYYRNEHSTAQVATALDESEATIRKRLERGRTMLKAQVAAMVEETLRKSGPGAAFVAGVMAAIPTTAGKASAATAGTAATAVVGTTAKLSILAPLGVALGMVGGIAGAVMGTLNDLRRAGSKRERTMILYGAAAMTAWYVVLTFAFLAMVSNNQQLGLTVYHILHTTLMAVALFPLGAMSACFMTHIRRIRIEDGTDVANELPKVNAKKQLHGIAGGSAGGFFGGLAFLFSASFAASAWLILGTLIVTSALAFGIAMRFLYRRGIPSAQRVLFGLLAFAAIAYFAIVNLKLNPWIAAGAEIPLANNVIMEPFPLWVANLCLACGVLVTSASIWGMARYCWPQEPMATRKTA